MFGTAFDSKDLLLLSSVRFNSRESLTRLSRSTGVPVSTIFERLKRYEHGLIRRYTALLDFSVLGFDLKVRLMLKSGRKSREDLGIFLQNHPNVNSLERISNGFDFTVEALFRDMRCYQEFCDKLESFDLEDKKEYYVLDELKKE
ncbi:MAG: Lrp/AsnC family transcriptional regulator, partial [Candidatus Woesearchaeota archaeon]